MSEVDSAGNKRAKTGGRKPGVTNIATRQAREAIAMFVDGNADRLQTWLDQIAEDPKFGPAAAFDRFMSVVEYHVPKLARTELTGKDGGPVQIVAGQDDKAL
jgi:hypothetical protein